jgi:hypothetical protein
MVGHSFVVVVHAATVPDFQVVDERARPTVIALGTTAREPRTLCFGFAWQYFCDRIPNFFREHFELGCIFDASAFSNKYIALARGASVIAKVFLTQDKLN